MEFSSHLIRIFNSQLEYISAKISNFINLVFPNFSSQVTKNQTKPIRIIPVSDGWKAIIYLIDCKKNKKILPPEKNWRLGLNNFLPFLHQSEIEFYQQKAENWVGEKSNLIHSENRFNHFHLDCLLFLIFHKLSVWKLVMDRNWIILIGYHFLFSGS